MSDRIVSASLATGQSPADSVLRKVIELSKGKTSSERLREGIGLPRSARWVSGLALFIVFLGHAVALGIASEAGLFRGFLFLVAFMAAAAIFGSLGRSSARSARLRTRAMIASAGPSYVLWLRPFSFDLANVISRHKVWDSTGGSSVNVTMEELIGVTCLRNGLGFRSVGEKDQRNTLISSAETFYDEEWREAIVNGMIGAELIFVVPNHSEGSFWEITKLVELNLCKKTIFIMPTMGMVSSSHSEFDIAKNWDATQKRIIDELRLPFPRYSEGGALFSWAIGSNGADIDIAPLSINHLATAIATLTTSVPA